MPQPRATSTSTQKWTWVGTSNPDEMIFAVFVDTDNITLTNKPVRHRPAFGSVPERPATKFKDLASVFRLASLCSIGVGDWDFIGESIQTGKSTFYFFVSKTAEEMNIPFDEERKSGNHPWPAVLKEVTIDSDYNFPISTNSDDGGVITGPTNYIRSVMDQEMEEGSYFITQKFLSSVRPTVIHHKVPHPDNVPVQINGASREFVRVLHDDLSVDASRSGTSKTVAGVTSAIGGSVGGLFFPKTNFTHRKPYVQFDEAVRNALGLWERTKVTVYPPKQLTTN